MSRSTTLDGLPKQFISSMRKLFDILADKKSGLVRFGDIESRWNHEGSSEVPKGVIESLRKVTPSTGLLTFERFCAGLKICLLRNHLESQKPGHHPTGVTRPPSAPLLDVDMEVEEVTRHHIDHIHISTPQQRTVSLPQLAQEKKESSSDSELKSYNNEVPLPSSLELAPPKPPREYLNYRRRPSSAMEQGTLQQRGVDSQMSRTEIRLALHTWQQEMINQENRERGDGRTGAANPDVKPDAAVQDNDGQHRKQSSRRREPRRHTLQSGIDYSMLKRLKLCEQERDVLLQGLQCVERAREWYHHKMVHVRAKMKEIGKGGGIEYSTESHQERLNFQAARIADVNQHLGVLVESSEKGFPLHMNLAISNPWSNTKNNDTEMANIINGLKQQNHLLTEEVGEKSERITILEREKAALIRELFQARSQGRGVGGHDETTFI